MNRADFLIVFAFLLAFALQVSAQDVSVPYTSTKTSKKGIIKSLEIGDVSPNELDSYKFFAEGKLNKLKLGISTKEAVRTFFGVPKLESKNIDFYDYDDDWQIQFIYFDEQISTIYTSTFRNGIQINTKLVPLTEVIGKISKIRLIPKKFISFSQITFSNQFSKQINSGSYDSEMKKVFEYYIYQDSFGLEYRILDKMISSNPENTKSRSQLSLMSIEYTIPYKLKEKIFVEQK